MHYVMDVYNYLFSHTSTIATVNVPCMYCGIRSIECTFHSWCMAKSGGPPSTSCQNKTDIVIRFGTIARVFKSEREKTNDIKADNFGAAKKI
jgi:hypothetical protein